MNPVLVFAPEGYTTRQGKLMGRMAATEGLLRALIRHGTQNRLLAYLLHPSATQHFAPMAAALGNRLPTETIQPARIGDVARHGPLLMPGPDIGRLAGLRAMAGADAAFSLVGVTYTLSSMGVMRAIAELATRPIHPWDAVICATRSGQAMINATFGCRGSAAGRTPWRHALHPPCPSGDPAGHRLRELPPDARTARRMARAHRRRRAGYRAALPGPRLLACQGASLADAGRRRPCRAPPATGREAASAGLRLVFQ